MSAFNMHRRIEKLEAGASGGEHRRNCFFWASGQALDDALDHAGLTLDDPALFCIRLEGVHPGEKSPRLDPLFERDKHLIA